MSELQADVAGCSGTWKWTFSIRSLLVVTTAISAVLACWTYLGGSGLVISLVLLGLLFRTTRRPSAVALVLLCLFGKWSYDKLQQAAAITHFERLGAHLVTDDDFPLVFEDVERLEKSPHARISDRDLAWLQLAPSIEVVWLDGAAVTDAGVRHIRELPRLRWLDLAETRVTNAGLVHVGQLPSLEKLVLNDTRISDAGLIHLRRLADLEELHLNDADVTAGGVCELKKALPKCKIFH